MARYEDDDDDDRDDEEEEEGRSIKKKRKRSDPSQGGFLGFVLFRKFVGDWIIIIVYWVFVVLGVIGSLVYMVLGVIGALQLPGGGAKAFFIFVTLGVGLVGMILGPVVLRIYAEMAILFYRMQEHLREIRDNTR